ncbi:hypothetical protein LZG04_27560 [Saccharothrix sp. S26]|uniref:hypothetical protein n=1 Tax=Saccharothrix sp. S26 TaxID=2907215 RepID=UPI001F39F885|nr:hypothetical protein [Saccharothrix sp. S26]MCE6998529.1 hypothetical protein [Saccharothrix sp. S26]
MVKQLQGEYHGSRALYGELDEATMLSQLEVACSRIKDCERDGIWYDDRPQLRRVRQPR